MSDSEETTETSSEDRFFGVKTKIASGVPDPDPADSDIEIEVVDDVPKSDRNRKPSTPPNEVTDEELEDYSEKVRNRIKHFSKGYHDERRAKEQAHRERQELESFAKTLVEENNQLKGTVDKNQAALLEQAKRTAAGEALQMFPASVPVFCIWMLPTSFAACFKASKAGGRSNFAIWFHVVAAPIRSIPS